MLPTDEGKSRHMKYNNKNTRETRRNNGQQTDAANREEQRLESNLLPLLPRTHRVLLATPTANVTPPTRREYSSYQIKPKQVGEGGGGTSNHACTSRVPTGPWKGLSTTVFPRARSAEHHVGSAAWCPASSTQAELHTYTHPTHGFRHRVHTYGLPCTWTSIRHFRSDNLIGVSCRASR